MSGEYTDIVLLCVDCKCEFIWTAGEQRFYETKGLTQPKRCKNCREARKSMRSYGTGVIIALPPHDKDAEEINEKESRRNRRRRDW